MSGLVVDRFWSEATVSDLWPGVKVLVVESGAVGIVTSTAPSGKRFVVKLRGGDVECYKPNELLFRREVRADMIREANMGMTGGVDASMMGDAADANDPEVQRMGMLRARIARDQGDLMKLQMSWAKKKQREANQNKPKLQPGQFTPQQMAAMQQRSAQNAQAAMQQGGFPTMQQTR